MEGASHQAKLLNLGRSLTVPLARVLVVDDDVFFGQDEEVGVCNLLRRSMNEIKHSQEACLQPERGERSSLLARKTMTHVRTVPTNLVHRHSSSEQHLVELRSQQLDDHFLACIKVHEVRDTPEWRTIDDTCEAISNWLV